MFDPKDYPANWSELRAAILRRAHFACERCGVLNHRHIVRSDVDPVLYRYVYPRDIAAEERAGHHVVTVVLTIAHLPEATDRMDARPEMLIALCQRCHLNLDRPSTLAKRRARRDAARGQLALT